MRARLLPSLVYRLGRSPALPINQQLPDQPGISPIDIVLYTSPLAEIDDQSQLLGPGDIEADWQRFIKGLEFGKTAQIAGFSIN